MNLVPLHILLQITENQINPPAAPSNRLLVKARLKENKVSDISPQDQNTLKSVSLFPVQKASLFLAFLMLLLTGSGKWKMISLYKTLFVYASPLYLLQDALVCN